MAQEGPLPAALQLAQAALRAQAIALLLQTGSLVMSALCLKWLSLPCSPFSLCSAETCL